MPNDSIHKIEGLLRDSPPLPDNLWLEAQERFATRAVAARLADITFEDHDTPLGRMRISATRTGIVRLSFQAEDPEAVLADLAQKMSPKILRASTPAITATRRELDEYFSGRRQVFDVPLDWALTGAFRREVLRITSQIPYGATSSYQRVAAAAGSPRASRAAGSALANNPLPILIPCHRVLRADGSFGQYLGGVTAKEMLLALEREGG